MAIVSAKIAEQIGNCGIYGRIELECSIIDFNLPIEISMNTEFERWKPGVLFGANYFMEHINDQVGLKLKVIDLDYHDVDTNNVVIGYLTIMALSEATHYSLRSEISFDRNNKSFLFPK
jgi:hypothetical protein